MPEASRFAILGTAGHIDHGKTALVELLTGTDTDRLKEEKARGISIDLGFARLELPGGISCGVVDVPGHERFVKNMLAGACGVDAMLLVVAADEGVMPQTREHLDILDLLGVDRGVVAVTKIDLVDEEWLELATETVREYLADRGFGHFPVVCVSSRTGEGREELLDALAATLGDLEARPTARAFRLPVDRAFVVEGFGTVVTGTLWKGTLRPGDAIAVEPGGVETRARKVEVHGGQVPEARAGQRTAVALAGVAKEQVPRGTWLLAPGSLSVSHMLDVRIRVLREAPKALRQRQRIRFHLGASEVLGRVVLLEGDALAPGKRGLGQIRLEAPVVADRGDRFVLRSYSPTRAIAGGTVILPHAPKRRRRHPGVLEELRREESGSVEDRVLAALDGFPAGAGGVELAGKTGLAAGEVDTAVANLETGGQALRLSTGLVVSRTALDRLKTRAVGILEELQQTHPLRWGTSRGELGSRLAGKLPPALLEQVTRELGAEGRVTEKREHFRVGNPEPQLSSELRDRVRKTARALEQGGVSPPTRKELEADLGGSVQDVLEHLTFEGEAVKVSPELFLNRLQFNKLVEWVRDHFTGHPQLSVGELRDAWGMSRKYSVPILEYLDKQGWTRRAGDVRVPGRRLDG